MSYPHYPRPPVNVTPYPSSLSVNANLGQPSATPPLTIIPSGTTVLAYYQDYAWYFGVVQSYNLTRSGSLIYQVLFRSGEIRSVASSQVLSQQSNNQNIEIGSRVVVQHPTKSMFISSLVAELPSVENVFRYLLFLDDGSACYKTKDKLWVINLNENPILMLPPPYKSFIQRYFTMTGSTVKLINLNPNDSVNFTNYDNTNLQFTGKVVEVDCSIALIRYSIPSGGLAEEWIHRGSSRILSYGHNQYYSTAGDLQKHNGSAKQMQNQSSHNFDANQAAEDQQMFIKSPLKGKPYMVPPSLDPFMFSEDENAMPSVSKSAKYNTFNSWPVSNNTTSRNTTYGNQMFSPKHGSTVPQPQSPILILDESPSKDPPPYTSPKPPAPSFPSSASSNQSPSKSYNDNFMSPSSLSLSPHAYKPASVFSWSASEESGTRRRLDLSPKLSTDHDVEFDFADTILNTPVSSAVTPPTFSAPLAEKPHFEETNIEPKVKKEEVVIIDDEDNLPPLVIENESSKDKVMLLDATQIQVKDSFKNETTTRNVPMILHQEACLDNFTATSTMESSAQNGNVIEVVVHSSNNGEAFISVTPSVEVVTAPIETETVQEKEKEPEDEKIPEPLKVEIKEESSSPPITTNSRKRRMVSPVKSPKVAIPKVKINLKAISESSKDLAAQKCVKRARKQQSKDANKDSKQAIAEKKKKIAKINEMKMKSLLTPKKDPIKINSEAKISRWSSPWCCRTAGSTYRSKHQQDSDTAFGEILQKVGMLKTDEELEEGEIDDSDGDGEGDEPNDKRSPLLPTSSQCPHTCSFLCNRFSSSITSVASPFSYPIQFGWERINKNDKITYISPCGIVCMDEADVLNHLSLTKCITLYSSNFCFLPEISLDLSSSKPEFEPLYSDGDLSNGLESVPVSFLSNIGPIIKYSFHYVIDRIHDSTLNQFDSDLPSCTCEGFCTSSCPCISTLGERSECNSICSCTVGCSNRVVQRGLQQQLQIIQDDTSFRVKALHDIPKNTFICVVTGVVKKLVPESENFLFPLSHAPYATDPKETPTPEEVLTKTENPKSGPRSIFYHDDPNLITSTGLESLNRISDRELSKSVQHNMYWVKAASKYGSLQTLADPELASSYPSLLMGRREPPHRSKRLSSTSRDQCSIKTKKAEIYLDCTEYGNIGRFVPMGDNFNTEIQPVIIDSSSVPWLAIYSTSNIPKDSFLVLKSFKR